MTRRHARATSNESVEKIGGGRDPDDPEPHVGIMRRDEARGENDA